MLQPLKGSPFRTGSTRGSLPFGERDLRGDGNFAFASLNGHHTPTQVAGLPIHLDPLLQELLLQRWEEGSLKRRGRRFPQVSEHTGIQSLPSQPSPSAMWATKGVLERHQGEYRWGTRCACMCTAYVANESVVWGRGRNDAPEVTSQLHFNFLCFLS